MLTDEELIWRYRDNGDTASLNMLLDRHLSRVWRIAYGMVCHRHDADDLTQEILIRAIRGISKYDGRASFQTWLYRISVNTAYNFLKQRATLHADNFEVQVEFGTPEHERPICRVAFEELQGEIGMALAQLTPPLRAAIVLTAIEGLSPRQAADAQQCSLGTIYWRIHVARQRLRKLLKGYLE